MPRIHTVAQDSLITASDKLIGSDGAQNNGFVTRNYSVGGIKNFVLDGTHAGSFTTLTTSGNATIGGNLSVTGNATIAGNLIFGDADTDTVSFSADVNSHILPDVTNTYDLGSATKQWRDIYVDGTAYIDHMDLLEVGPHVAVGQGGDEAYTIYDNNAVLSRNTENYGLSIINTPLNNNGNASLILGTSDQMDGVQMGYNVSAYTKEFTINMRGTQFMKLADHGGKSISLKQNTNIDTDKGFTAGNGTGAVTFVNAPSIGPSNDRYQLVGGRPSSDNQFLKYTTNGVTEWNDPITPITDVAAFTTLNIQDPMTLSQRSYHRIILGNTTLVNSQQKAARISSYTHIDLQADADNNGITGTQQSNPATGGDLRFLSANTLKFLVNGDSGKIYINPKESDSLILPDARGTEGHYLKQGANGQAEWASAVGVPHIINTTYFTNSVAIGYDSWSAGGPQSGDGGAIENVAVGVGAMNSILQGDGNVSIGYNANTGVSFGDFNIAIGHKAGASSDSSAANLTSGKRNILIGANAGVDNAGTYNAIIIGTHHDIDNGDGIVASSHQTIIGNDETKDAVVKGLKQEVRTSPATDTLSDVRGTDANKITLLDSTSAITITLRDSGDGGEVGKKYTFITKTAPTGGDIHKIVCSDTTNEKFIGGVIFAGGANTHNNTAYLYKIPESSNISAINLNGGNQGGEVGTKIEIVNIAAGLWHVSGQTHHPSSNSFSDAIYSTS